MIGYMLQVDISLQVAWSAINFAIVKIKSL